MCNKHINETCDCISMLCSIALSMAWKSWQRGHLGLPVDLHTQGTRPLIPPPPLSALQLLVAEQFTKRAYMQCCKPSIRQEGNSQLPRPGTCPLHFGQGVLWGHMLPFSFVNSWVIQARAVSHSNQIYNQRVRQTRCSNSSKSVKIIYYFEDWKTSYFNFNFSLPYCKSFPSIF